MMNSKIALAVMAFTGHVFGREYIQHFDSSTVEREPYLTTITTDIGFPFTTHTSVGEMAMTVIDSSVCRPVTTTHCEVVQFTSVVSNETHVTQSVPHSTHTATVVTSGSITGTQVSSASSGSSAASSGTSTAPSVTSGTSTPIPTSGGKKHGNADAAGALAAIAALLFV